MSFLLCPGQAGQFVMMYYDQATGMLVPIMSTFAPQSIFEMPPAFPPNATLSDPEPKESLDTFTENISGPKKPFGKKSSFDQENAEISDDEQGSEYGGKSSPAKQQRKKKAGSQNQNRNIIPNIIQQIFSYLSKAKKSRVVCQRAFKCHPVPVGTCYSVSRFYIYHKLIKDSMNHYVNQNTLALFHEPSDAFLDIFSREEQQFYLKITRVMVAFFLNNISPLLTIKSKRMGKEKRIEHLRVRRFLFKRLKSRVID